MESNETIRFSKTIVTHNRVPQQSGPRPSVPVRRRKTSMDQAASAVKVTEPRCKHRERNEALAQSEVLGHSVDLLTQLNQTEFSRNIRDEDENETQPEVSTLKGQAESYQEEAKKVRREVELRN